MATKAGVESHHHCRHRQGRVPVTVPQLIPPVLREAYKLALRQPFAPLI